MSSYEQQVEQGLRSVYTKYPHLKRNQAQDKAIRDLCNRFATREVVPNADLYALALYDSQTFSGVIESAPKGPASTYAAESGAQQAHQATTAQEQANRAAWEQILLKYAIASHDGNYSMVRDYCGNAITVEKFEFLINNRPKGFQLDWTDEREQLLNDILDLLFDPYGRRMSTADLKNAKNQMLYWSRQRLRARLAEVQTKQAMAQKSAGQLRSDRAAVRKAAEVERPYPGYPTLLSTIVPRGQIQAVSTKDYLQQIAKHDLFEFKRFVRLYGSQQIDDIRLGRRY